MTCSINNKTKNTAKKAVSVILIVIMGLFLSAFAEDSDQTDTDGHTYTSKTVDVYRTIERSENTKDGTITLRFYEDLPNVAYVSVKDYYSTILKNSRDYSDPHLEVTMSEDGIYLMKSATGEAVIDTCSDVLTTEDLMLFMDQSSVLHEGLVKSALTSTKPFCRTVSLACEKKEAVYDMGRYHIDVRTDTSDVYFPVAALSDLTSNTGFYTTYNGENFYYHENPYSDNVDNTDINYYSVRLQDAAEGGTRPEDLIEFSYNELCFAIDHFYGMPGREAIHDDLVKYGLDTSLRNLGEAGETIIGLLHSDSWAEYFAGISRLQYLLADGGHTAINNISKKAMKNAELMDQYTAVNNELNSLFEEYAGNTERKEKQDNMLIVRRAQRDALLDRDDETYVKRGDTAVCILDSFGCRIEDVWDDYYDGNIDTPTLDDLEEDCIPDAVLIVLDAVNKAAADPEIKNLIIDVSNNGGGCSDEMNAVIAILTGNRIVTTFSKNSFTGAVSRIVTEVDCNLDRVFDERDNLRHDLNIGILTSSSSYSCGNIFPMYMKDAGYPILGEQSGGGTCAIGKMAAAEGFTFPISSSLSAYVDKEGDSHDEGIPVDTDLLQRAEDGRVQETDMEALLDPEYPEYGSIIVTMPDYSEFYNIDRLSKEMNSYGQEATTV